MSRKKTGNWGTKAGPKCNSLLRTCVVAFTLLLQGMPCPQFITTTVYFFHLFCCRNHKLLGIFCYNIIR